MKIGRFASGNNISIDAVRHYMALGLIIPQKGSGQYDFDDKCQSDLDELLSLKAMGFSLNEIKAVFNLKRFGRFSPYRETDFYRDIFLNKRIELSDRINALLDMKKGLEARLEELPAKEGAGAVHTGIDISRLSIFACAKCGGGLTLNASHVADSQVMKGALLCKCGEAYAIHDGILAAEGGSCRGGGEEAACDLITNYVRATDEEYLHNVYTGLEWHRKRLDTAGLSGKTLLELGTGLGFFLRHVLGELPGDSLYIAVDRDYSAHRLLKSMLNSEGLGGNIIFICSDFLKMPLKNRTADIVIDFSGTSNYSFENEDFLLERVDRYAGDNALLLGSYIMFGRFAPDSGVAEVFRKNFRLPEVKRKIARLGYSTVEDSISDGVDRGGRYESYFREGEEVYTYAVHAKRSGRPEV